MKQTLTISLLLAAVAGCTHLTQTTDMSIFNFPSQRRPAGTSVTEIGFEKEFWQASNCHLTLQDFALLKVIRDRAEAANPFHVQMIPSSSWPATPAPASPVTQKSPLELEVQASLDDANKDFSTQIAGADLFQDQTAAKARLAAAEAELAPQTIVQLVAAAQQNPRFSACILTISANGQEEFGRVIESDAYRNSLKNPISVTDFLGLGNTGMMGIQEPPDAAASFPSADELVAKNLMDIGFSARSLLGSVNWGVQTAVGKNLILVADVRTGSATVKFRGEPIQYIVGYGAHDRSKSNLPVSAYIAPTEISDMLFDEGTLSCLDVDSGGSSYVTTKRPAKDFAVGKSAGEQTLAKYISTCMSGFKAGTSSTGLSVAEYFNHYCGNSTNQMMLFVPMETMTLPAMDWSQVNAQTMTDKTDTNELDPINALRGPSEGVFFKQFLRLSGHSTSLNFVAQGTLLVGDMAQFMQSAHDAKIANHVDQLVHQLSLVGYEFSVPAKGRRAQVDFKHFSRSGGIELLMSVMAKNYDTISISFGQNFKTGQVEVIGLNSVMGQVDSLIEQSDRLTADEKTQLITASSQLASCGSQYALLIGALQASLDVDPSQSHAAAKKALARVSEITNREAQTMSGECRKPILDSINASIAKAKQLL